LAHDRACCRRAGQDYARHNRSVRAILRAAYQRVVADVAMATRIRRLGFEVLQLVLEAPGKWAWGASDSTFARWRSRREHFVYDRLHLVSRQRCDGRGRGRREPTPSRGRRAAGCGRREQAKADRQRRPPTERSLYVEFLRIELLRGLLPLSSAECH
jgi:hypothetical protein